MEQPLVSIIIPCFNSGIFLTEALTSIENNCNYSNHEVIIVNDGSTDEFTLNILNVLKSSHYTVIHQENKGPAAARNMGISSSKGEFIFFLDSDNKIKSSYLEKGIKILLNNKDIGVVYSNASFFGDTTEKRFYPQPFNMYKLLQLNYIDMCSLIRKEVWEQLGGLDENRTIIGHEDWDFWIRVGEAGWQFYYLEEELFEYRISGSSLVKQATQPEKNAKMLFYLYAKHASIFIKYFKNTNMQPFLANMLYKLAVNKITEKDKVGGRKYLAYAIYYSNFKFSFIKNGLYWFKESLRSNLNIVVC